MGLRKLSPTSKLELGSSAFQALAVVGLQSAIAVVFSSSIEAGSSSSSVSSVTVYLVLFILSLVYQFALVVNAARFLATIWEQNVIQLCVHVVFNGCLFGYSILELTQLESALASQPNGLAAYDAIYPMLVASSAVLAFFTFIFAWCSFKLYREFGWERYKKIGATPSMHYVYRAYHIYLMVLKLDFYFFEVFAIQFLVLVLKPGDPEYYLTIVAIVLALPILFFAIYSIRLENYWMVAVWYLIMLGMMAYFVFKVVRMYEPSQMDKYVGSIKFLTFFATLSLLVTFTTLVTTSVCVSNFGKGLKANLMRHRKAPPPAQAADAPAIKLGDVGK